MRTYEHRNTAAGYEVWYVDEGCTKQVNKDKPDYVEWLKSNTPAIIPYIAPVLPTQAEINARICAQTIFRKLDIYRAMKALGNVAKLKATLKASEEFEYEWNCATEINVSDPAVAQALALMQVDVDAIKLKIYELQTNK